ncbi:MAG: carbohydrate-binding protein, partial [Planctomycetes bacterium]|nr:carbohydrate-binding protein [Planctomycetota bacterium]
YRNLALNPVDISAAGEAFPHASANSVCRGEPVFAARNAIDGSVDADGHGDWPHQSWGPDQKDGLVWRVDFGRTVEIDKVVVVLRAHVGHDKFWKGATLVLSDGTKKAVTFEPNGNLQPFALPATKITWVELRDFTWPEPRGWCAITEVEVWGRDVEPKP